MTLIRLYLRALGLLRPEGGRVAALAAANAVLALVALAEPWLFGQVVEALARAAPAGRLVALWAAIGLFGILAGVVVAVEADRLAHRRRLHALAQGFERAIALSPAWHAGAGSGATQRTLLAGADTLFGTWLTFLREQLAALVGLLCLIPAALAMDVRMAGLLGLLALVYATANIAVLRHTWDAQGAVERHHQAVAGRIGDVLGNLGLVQAYARLGAEAAALGDLIDRLLAAQMPVLTWWGLLACLTRAAATLTMVAVFALGALLADRGQITLAEIVTFVGFAGLMIARLDQVSSFIARLFVQAPTLAAYFALRDALSDVVERPGAMPPTNPGGGIVLAGVSYTHPGSGLGVHDIDLVVPPGATVALVGPTGAGKSTVLALVQRRADPQRGRILLGGEDLRDLTLDGLRAALAVVPQEAALLNRPLAENIRLGRPDAPAAAVETAARLAQAHDFIIARPGGYDALPGERGHALSGGERQRIALARAFLKDAPVLILDEATSALDTETEAAIAQALDRLRRGRTTLIVAHRLSTVAMADLIVVLEGGRIVARGSFADLRAQGGLFARLVARGDFTTPLPDAGGPAWPSGPADAPPAP